jgi:hypothetical protein
VRSYPTAANLYANYSGWKGAREPIGTLQHAIGNDSLANNFPFEAGCGHCRMRAMPDPAILNAFAVINTQSQHC